MKTMESSSALSRCIRRRFLALSSSVAWEDEGVATAAVDAEAWDQAESWSRLWATAAAALAFALALFLADFDIPGKVGKSSAELYWLCGWCALDVDPPALPRGLP